MARRFLADVLRQLALGDDLVPGLAAEVLLHLPEEAVIDDGEDDDQGQAGGQDHGLDGVDIRAGEGDGQRDGDADEAPDELQAPLGLLALLQALGDGAGQGVAFGARNTDVPMERFLTYEVSTDGRPMLPVVTIPTNPMSGSETNADVQITLDESGLQAGCSVGKAVFTWLNPEYVMSLPDRVLAYGQMTSFVRLSLNYLNLTRSPLAEHYAEASMKTVLECLRRSLADKRDMDARGTLLLNSALALSGINDLGRQGEFAPYPLQSFAQRYLGLDYPHALTGLFPYWLREIYRASEDKAIFHRYFSEILGVTTDGTDEEMLLQEALAALKKLYQEFGIAFRYGELATDPQDHGRLVEIIDSFGPMPCRIMLLTTERMAKMIEDAIAGQLDECV